MVADLNLLGSLGDLYCFKQYSLSMLVVVYRFCEGLETLDVLKSMKRYPTQFEEMFISQEENLTAALLETVFFDIKFSENGSNSRISEDRTVSFWRDFLIDVEGTNCY